MRERWLSLDLSGGNGSVSLHEATDTSVSLLREVTIAGARSHSERVLDEISGVLGSESLSTIDRFITTIGPGSFTGLRVATATLKAFCFALNRPLEIIGASEARALAWLASQSSEPKTVHVYTHLTVGKFDHATFEFRGAGEVHLSDGRVSLPEGIVFPLKASHLGQTLRQAKSRRTATSLDEWIALTPEYFGGRF